MAFSIFDNRTAVLFDLDGTLIDNTPHVIKCYQDAEAAIGHEPHPSGFIRDLQGISFELTAEALGVPKEHLQRFKSLFWEWMAVFDEAPDLLPGVMDTLNFCRNKGLPMAVVTSNHASIARAALRSLGIEDYFSVFIGSDVVKETKPHPRPVLAALEQLQILPSASVLMLGDSYYDLGSATNAQVDVAWVCERDDAERRLKDPRLVALLEQHGIPHFETMVELR